MISCTCVELTFQIPSSLLMVSEMREAGRIGVKALTEMMKSTRAGMYEYEKDSI